MPIWIKLKVFAPHDNISNPGTKYRTLDTREGPKLVDPDGSEAFHIRKGQFVPIPFEWKDLVPAKKRFDPEVFEFFRTKQEAMRKVKKEEKLLKMLPIRRFEERRKRVQEKVDKSRFGQNKPTMDDVIKEAKRIGIDIPFKPNK